MMHSFDDIHEQPLVEPHSEDTHVGLASLSQASRELYFLVVVYSCIADNIEPVCSPVFPIHFNRHHTNW